MLKNRVHVTVIPGKFKFSKMVHSSCVVLSCRTFTPVPVVTEGWRKAAANVSAHCLTETGDEPPTWKNRGIFKISEEMKE